MKKIRWILAVAFLCAAPLLGAQTYNVDEIVRADRNKAAGCEGPYRFDAAPLTPSPKGYKPFYISHYGRHGSRYAWNSNTYIHLKQALDAAAKANAFTPRGEQLYKDFLDFYEIPLINTGDLTDLGWQQHAEIARIMCESFPEVFKKGGDVQARASTSQRAIVSMNAFTVSLQKHAPKVNVVNNSLHTNMVVINAASAPKAIARQYAGDMLVPEQFNDFRARKTDYDGILNNLFTDRSFLKETVGETDFVHDLYFLWAGYRNYCDKLWLEDIFTPDQMVALWEIENYSCYFHHARQRYTQISLLMDMIACADEAIANGQFKGHFRFGHDTVFNALCPLLNVDGCGYEAASADEVKYWFQSYKTPMAATLQLVLYRSKKNPNILFKVLRNGNESTLPQLKPVQGPYYRWADFKAWADALMQAHPLVAE